MSFRWKFRDSAQTYVGATLPIVRIPNATVTVFLAGTTTAYGGTIWRNATGLTGGDQYANPFTTDVSGAIEFFLDVGIPVKVQVTKPSDPTVGTLTVDYEPMAPDPRDIVTSSKGGIVYLMDYAGGLAIDNGVVNMTFAATAAVAAAAATGAKIVIPPGTFVGTWLPTNGLHVEGAGPATILKRPNNTPTAIWDPRSVVGTKLSNVTLDGNWANNHAHVGANALVPEAHSGGTDNSFEDVVGQNWNWVLFKCAGDRSNWTRCGGKGRTPSTYEPDTGGSATTNYDSWTAFQSGADDFCVDMVFTDCWAESTRVGGMVIGGGLSTTIIAPRVRNTHRGESFCSVTQTVGTWTGVGFGGGQIAPLGTAAAPGHVNDQVPTNLNIIGPQIGYSDGAVVVGIELTGVIDGTIVAPQIGFQSGGSITLTTCTRVGIKGGTLRNAGQTELSVVDSEGCSWDGVKFFDHKNGVAITGTSDNWFSAGCYFKTTRTSSDHFSDTSSGARHQSGPHVVINTGSGIVDAGEVPTELMRHQTNGPAVLIRNTNAGGNGATSDGVEIRAGSTGFDAPWSVYTYNRGVQLAAVFGTGEAQHVSSTGNVLTLNTTAAAGLLAALRVQRSGTLRYSLGLDASDNPVILSSGGAALVTLNDAYATMATAPTLAQGGSIGITVSYARYKQFGKWVHVMASVIVASNTNAVANNIIVLTLPSATPNLSSARTGDFAVVGSANYFVTSVGWKSGNALAKTATTIQFARNDKADYWGSTTDPHPTAGKVQINDVFSIDCMYELS